jgi:Bacterial Ig domain/Putative Ig domain/Regulator of chromosome condensation (RCC1) repeat
MLLSRNPQQERSKAKGCTGRQHGSLIVRLFSVVVTVFTISMFGLPGIGSLNRATADSSAGVLGISRDASAAMDVGYNTECVVTSDHIVKCAGVPFGTGLTTIDVGGPAKAVSSGDQNGCAVLVDGRVNCFGPLPGMPAGFLDLGTASAKEVSVGKDFVCSLLDNGVVRCFGNFRPINDSAFGDLAVTLAVGWRHACAIMTTGGVRCFGDSINGELGGGSQTIDVPLGSGVRAVALALGVHYSCAIVGSGSVKCWGENNYGQLGSVGAGSDVPRDVSLPSSAVALAAGQGGTCAVLDSGRVYCWGSDDAGGLGQPTTTNNFLPPTAVVLPAGSFATTVSVGLRHACALLNDGSLWCWGFAQSIAPAVTGPYPPSNVYPPIQLDLFGTVGTGGLAPTVTSASPPSGTVGLPYSYAYVATGVPSAMTFSVVDASLLPPGLSLSTTGVLSGISTTAGSYTFGISASNGIAPDATTTSTVVVSVATIAPTFSVTVVPSGTVGSPYATTFSASGVPAAMTYSIVEAALLPPGLSLTGGVLSGTPTASGTYTFDVTASNGIAPNATRSVTIAIVAVAPTFTASSPPATGKVGELYLAYIFVATGVPNAMTYSITAGSLPSGLTMVNGVLSGTPSSAGSATFVVTASNGVLPNATTSITMNIAPADVAPTITSPLPVSGTVGVAYSHTFAANGNPTTFTYSVVSGSMPTGLTLSAVGVISGTPTTASSSSFVVQVSNGIAPAGNQTASIQIAPAPASPSFTASSPSATGTVGVAYPTYTFAATGVPATMTYSVSSGALPNGLTLTSNGVLSGTPTTADSSTFQVTATNGTLPNATVSITIDVVVPNSAPVFASTVVPGGTTGSAYSFTFVATGVPVTMTYSLAVGTLPSGLALSSAGVLSGIPTASGTFTFGVKAVNGPGSETTRSVTVAIVAGPQAPAFVASSPSLAAATGVAYPSYTFSATGVPSAMTYSVTDGALPAGLTLTSAGVLSGTPTTAGSSTFVVTASNGTSPDATVSITIVTAQSNRPPIADSKDITILEDSVASFALSGSDPDGDILTFEKIQPELHGVVNGTCFSGPTCSYTPIQNFNGLDQFMYIAKDPSFVVPTTLAEWNALLSRAGTVTIHVTPVNDAPTINVPGAQTATVGQPLRFNVNTADADGDVVTTTVAGVSAATIVNGQFSWTPTAAGTFTVTFTATDPSNATASASVTVTVNPLTTSQPVTLQVSDNSQHTDKVRALSGAALREGAYVFVGSLANAQNLVSSVAFSLDGNAVFTDTAAPFDLISSLGNRGLRLDTSLLANGAHTVSTLLTYRNGTTATISSTFTVNNGRNARSIVYSTSMNRAGSALNGANLSGATYYIALNPADTISGGVVAYFLDDVQVGPSTSQSPYEFGGRVKGRPVVVPIAIGTHILRAEVTLAGGVAISLPTATFTRGPGSSPPAVVFQ